MDVLLGGLLASGTHPAPDVDRGGLGSGVVGGGDLLRLGLRAADRSANEQKDFTAYIAS